MASRDTLFNPWEKYLLLARAHGTLKERGYQSERSFSICGYGVTVPRGSRACFLQSGQLVWVLPVGALTCHWGSFGTAARVHWVRGGARQCTATLGRNSPCGTRWGAFGQSGAAPHLKKQGTKRGKGSDVMESTRLLQVTLIKNKPAGSHLSPTYQNPDRAAHSAQGTVTQQWKH